MISRCEDVLKLPSFNKRVAKPTVTSTSPSNSASASRVSNSISPKRYSLVLIVIFHRPPQKSMTVPYCSGLLLGTYGRNDQFLFRAYVYMDTDVEHIDHSGIALQHDFGHLSIDSSGDWNNLTSGWTLTRPSSFHAAIA